MNGAEFRKLVADEPLLADGGLGTTLVERGVAIPHSPFELLNLDRPEDVAAVHRDFADAGARVVETNTFGANRYALARHGLEDRVAEINAAAVQLARRAGVLVAGSVGPLRVRLVPYGRVRKSQARAAYAEQITALASAGVDIVYVETQSDLTEMEEALRAARESCDLAVIVTATFTKDDRTLLDHTPEKVAARLTELGADAVGVNCSEGPAQVLRIVNAMRPHAGSTPLVAMPNAGSPSRVGERYVYAATPQYLGDYARAFVAAGASVVGGCCGTSPRHVAAMAKALAQPRLVDLELLPGVEEEINASARPVTSELGAKLDAGTFVITVEMDPPRSISVAGLLAGAETLRDAGADAIDLRDSPGARVHMSPWAPAHLIHEHVGLEAILHFPTRGRNLLRIQGDLLGVHALGVRNLFIALGDPARAGDYPASSDNVDVVPTGLLELITSSLNKGQDTTGEPIGEPTSFVCGCAVNLGAQDIDRECRLLRKKIRCGAVFALSQPVFSADVLRTFKKAYEERHGALQLPILVGLQPLVTAKNAEFLHNEMPGIVIPEHVFERMRGASDERDEGVAIAVEVGRELRADAAGIYLMTPFNRYGLAAEVVEAIKDGASHHGSV
jgi:homocysteine S-methyltransferase